MKPTLALLITVLLAISTIPADPMPGNVYKEFRYPITWGECDPGATAGFCPDREKMAVKSVPIDDLTDAIKAEVSVEIWGGHKGTSDQKFRVNNNAWVMIPQPTGTPSSAYCFYRTVFGRPAASIPLSYLKVGMNEFQFTCGPQICGNFNWGFYWIYSFTVRVYYDPAKKSHITGQITSPASNSTIGDIPLISAEVSDPSAVTKVNFVGYYEDFDFDGNGKYREWQYQMRKTIMKRTIGEVRSRPYQVYWDNPMVPDQAGQVQLAAVILFTRNYLYMTPAVNVTLKRSGRSVKMYKASNVPKTFGVRTGATESCNISVGDALTGATRAQLVLSSWSAKSEDNKPYYIKLNSYTISTDFGVLHNWSQDLFDIPLNQIRTGTNTFTIHAQTSGHALEVNWPGPALKVQWGPTVKMDDNSMNMPDPKGIGFSVVPNPVRLGGTVTLQSDQPLDRAQILDLSGRKAGDPDIRDNRLSWEKSGEPGLYLLKVFSGNRSSQCRILVTP